MLDSGGIFAMHQNVEKLRKHFSQNLEIIELNANNTPKQR